MRAKKNPNLVLSADANYIDNSITKTNPGGSRKLKEWKKNTLFRRFLLRKTCNNLVLLFIFVVWQVYIFVTSLVSPQRIISKSRLDPIRKLVIIKLEHLYSKTYSHNPGKLVPITSRTTRFSNLRADCTNGPADDEKGVETSCWCFSIMIYSLNNTD